MRKLLPVLLLLVPTSALAQEPRVPEDIPPGKDVIEYVQKGDPAPYSGQLFTDGTALRWANWTKQYREFYRIDLEKQLLLRAADQRNYQIRVDALKEYNARVTADYERRLREQEVGWYETPWFGAALGATGVVSLVVLGAWATK